MEPSLQRGGLISFGFHIAMLITIVLVLPARRVPNMGEPMGVEIALEVGPVQRAPTPGPTPSPRPAPTPAPPAPPTQTASAAPAASPSPPVPTPSVPPAPPLPLPPVPPLTPPRPPLPRTEAAPPPNVPVTTAPAALPAPPPVLPPTHFTPPRPPQPPATPQTASPPAMPPLPPQTRPATSPAATPAIPPPATRPGPSALEAALQAARQHSGQTGPGPAAQPRGGAPGGGQPTGVENAALSASARGAIGDRIRECWTRDAGALDADKMIAKLSITTDAAGVIRDAKIMQSPPGNAGRAFAERAVRAAMSAQCATLPLPAGMMGAVHTFEITFRP